MPAAMPMTGTKRPTSRPSAPAAFAAPSGVHQAPGTPYCSMAATTNGARARSE